MNWPPVSYQVGDIVYFKTDTDQRPWMILGYSVVRDCLKYILGQINSECCALEYEISGERNESLVLGLDNKVTS